jgi:hypothetical protein
MRKTSNSLSTQYSQQPKQFRGGEKKVMKKSLSLLVASSMVLSMFASSAFAAETKAPTQEEKFAALKELGIFSGFPDGSAGLDKNMTRAQFAKVLTVSTGLEENAAASTYSDVSATHWAKGYIGAVTEAQLMQGKGNNKFDPNGNVTIQELAKTLVLSLGLEPVEGATVEGASAWAVGYVQAALDAKIIPSSTNYNVPATRGQLVDAIYAVVGPEEEVADLKVAKVSQTGAKVIKVEFNRALTEAEQKDVTFALKQDAISYTVTKAVSADAKSVTLTASYLPAGTYTVEISGQDAQTVTVAEGKVSKLEVGAAALMVGTNQALSVKAYDQFGTAIDNESFDISAYNGTKGKPLTVLNGSVDLTNSTDVAKGDIVVVTAVHAATGTSVSKTFTVSDASTISSLKLGTVAPKDGAARITKGDEGLVLPYTFVDANGNKYVLPTTGVVTASNNSVKFGDITLIATGYATNGNKIVDAASFSVDSDGVLTFDADEAGTVVITALNPTAGASSSATVVVSDTSKVAKFQISKPSVLVAAGESPVIPFAATDNYGAQITASQFAKKDVNSQVTFMVNGTAVTPTWNSKGELKLPFAVAGSTTVYAVVNGLVSSYFTVDVKTAAVATKVASNNDLATYYSINGTDTIDYNSVIINDNYGRRVWSNNGLLFAVKDGNADVASVSAAGVVKGLATGTETIVVGLNDGNGAIKSGTSIEIKVNVIADDKVTAFTIDDLNSVNTVSKYATEAINLVGKTSEGKTVAIDQTRFLTSVTSSNLGLVNVTGNTVLNYVGNGEVTLTAWNGATKLAEKVVKSSDAAQQAVKVAFDNTEVTVSGQTEINNIIADLYVEDQYGIDITTAAKATGTWASSDNSVIKLNANGTIASQSANGGSATISFITNNAVIGTVSIIVQ